MSKNFPPGFVWGTATAAYQIEGAIAEDGKGPSIWDEFVRRPGAIANGDTGDIACDHYHRYESDAALLAEIGAKFYRFSIAWPRIVPEGRGAVNQAGIDFYRRLLDALESYGVRPWVTLYHWDLPQALEEHGGWRNRDTALYFADYVSTIHEALHDRVEHWTSLNEPFCSAFYGYASGVQAPGVRDRAGALAAGHHLLLGHGLATQRMRTQDASSKVGITLNLSPTVAATESQADRDAARRIDARKNRFFLDPLFTGAYPADMMEEVAALRFDELVEDGDLDTINAPLDFLGVNYYRRFVVKAAAGAAETAEQGDDETPTAGAVTPYVLCDDIEFVKSGLPVSSMGWEVDPDGLRQLLNRVSDDYVTPPLFITENGMAVNDVVGPDGHVHDAERIDFLEAHLEASLAAIDDGVDLRGYFAWSSFDNFEWALGLEKRFGLIHVDYESQVRTLKDSAHWYHSLVTANSLPDRETSKIA